MSIDPRVERVTIVEIEPLVPEVAANYSSEYNFDVVGNPKVQVRIDDGHHYLLTTKDRFDAITVDPLRRSDLADWLKGAAINLDRNLRMQYLAGIGINLDDSAAIYADMLAHRRFPEDLFVSAEERVDSLRKMIESGGR